MFPSSSPFLLQRLQRALPRQPEGSSPALGALLDEALKVQRQTALGIHPPAPHPAVEKLLGHRWAVATRYLDHLDHYHLQLEDSEARQTAFREAQRARYEAHKRWQSEPALHGAKAQHLEAADQDAVIQLGLAEHETLHAHKQVQAQRSMLEHWDDQLLLAHRAVCQARDRTERPLVPSTRPTPVRVPVQAPALRVRPR